MDLSPGVAIARAEAVALRVFVAGRTPAPEEIYGVLRPLCASIAETEQVWQLVSVRLAELQAAADGFPVRSINVRAA